MRQPKYVFSFRSVNISCFSNEDISNVLDCIVYPGADNGLDGDTSCARICAGNHQPIDQTSFSVSVSARSI